MPAYTITVRPYNSALRPHLKAMMRVRHPSGKVERVFFKTLKEAVAEETAKKTEVQNTGIRALGLDNRTRLESLDAVERLQPLGISLSEAVNFYLDHHRGGTHTVKDLCDVFIASRKENGASVRHMDSLRRVTNRFTEALGAIRASALRPEEVEKWLHDQGISAISFNSYRRLLHAVFQYGTERSLIKENPIAKVVLLKEKPSRVGILTPGQMEKLIAAAANEPDVLATILIGGFAGLRPEEIARLKWSAIDLEHGQVDCGSEITKTGSYRYVPIEPVLAAWLKKIWPSSHPNGDIQEDNFRRRYDAVRRDAGFAVRGPQLLDDEGKPLSHETVEAYYAARMPWPHDALRHSYASYHLAYFKKPEELSLHMGHTGTKMLFKNYRSRVSERVAGEWWGIFPKN